MLLTDKAILVSGTGPGLGAACASAALREGAKVAITSRDPARVGKLALELDSSGDRVVAIGADVTDPTALDRAVTFTLERFGRLDGVVSVAAYDTLLSPILETDADGFDDVFSVNVVGAINLVAATAEAMASGGGGSVVLIGSQAALRPVPALPQGAYGASKAALLAVARELAHDLGPRKIRVNTVVPSWMWGPNVELYCRWQAGERDTTPDAIKAEIAAEMALGVIPTVADVAEAVVFFLSDRAKMITGQRLLVNAGEYFDT